MHLQFAHVLQSVCSKGASGHTLLQVHCAVEQNLRAYK